MSEDNVRRFRNRLRGLRDRWRAGTIAYADVDSRVRAWIAHAKFAKTRRLRHAIFKGGWFDPMARPCPWDTAFLKPDGLPVVGSFAAVTVFWRAFGATNNNPRNLRVAPKARKPKSRTATGTPLATGTTTTASALPARSNARAGGPKFPPGAH